LWAQLGLRTAVTNPCADEEQISSIRVMPDAPYIPYTAKRLKWHTDGYYNAGAQTICAFAMHCVTPAEQGGENQYFDPEILYILLRDENPTYVTALMRPDTFTVAPNPDEPGLARARNGAVLSIRQSDGALVMRYSERRRYLSWREDATTTAARQFIEEALQQRKEYRITYRLKAGEGVICNNVVHNRSGFSADARPARLLYRARYRERIADSGPTQLLSA